MVGEVLPLLIGILTSGGLASLLTVGATNRRNKAQTEGEARVAYTGEFEAVVVGLNTQIDQLQQDIGYLRGEIELLRKEVAEERRFTEFVRLGIENGTVPPWPDRYSVIQSQHN